MLRRRLPSGPISRILRRMGVTTSDSGERSDERDANLYRVSGALTITRAASTQREIDAIADPLTIDLGGVEKMDTVGAWLIHRAVRDRGAKVIGAAPEEQRIARPGRRGRPSDAGCAPKSPIRRRARSTSLATGRSRPAARWSAWSASSARCSIGLASIIRRPKRFRLNAVVQRFDLVGVRALGIIGLMTFLIGIVIGQQGAVQLAAFGAEVYTINLIGRLSIRELATLMTAIMVAGRSGSAFAAQLGTMKITEEIDAMRTIGVSPVEALVIPRMLAATIMMPLAVLLRDDDVAARRRHLRVGRPRHSARRPSSSASRKSCR